MQRYLCFRVSYEIGSDLRTHSIKFGLSCHPPIPRIAMSLIYKMRSCLLITSQWLLGYALLFQTRTLLCGAIER